jgi:hypothetical protein
MVRCSVLLSTSGRNAFPPIKRKPESVTTLTERTIIPLPNGQSLPIAEGSIGYRNALSLDRLFGGKRMFQIAHNASLFCVVVTPHNLGRLMQNHAQQGMINF